MRRIWRRRPNLHLGVFKKGNKSFIFNLTNLYRYFICELQTSSTYSNDKA